MLVIHDSRCYGKGNTLFRVFPRVTTRPVDPGIESRDVFLRISPVESGTGQEVFVETQPRVGLGRMLPVEAHHFFFHYCFLRLLTS